MNRKMRAKLNNAEAKARKDRRPCPDRDKVFTEGEKDCPSCGAELLPAALVVAVPRPRQKETLH